jgi:hypothetical protein
MLAASFAMVWLLSGCSSEPEEPGTPQSTSTPKPAARHVDDTPPPIPQVDPGTLDPDKKKSYDKGYAQGQRLVARYQGVSMEDAMKDRDIAIQAAIQKTGRNDSALVLEACGRKAGLKAALAAQPAAAGKAEKADKPEKADKAEKADTPEKADK